MVTFTLLLSWISSHRSESPKFVRRHFFDRRKDGRHRVVNPDIDLAQFSLDLFRCGFDLLRVPNIGGDHQRFTAEFFHLSLRSFQSIHSACYQTDSRAVADEVPHGRAANAQPTRL
jgi:hypothetical protein